MDARRIATRRLARFYTLGGEDGVTSAWIACHGFGQLGATFAEEVAPAASPARRIVVPEALNRFYFVNEADGSHGDNRVGATWMTREDREAEIADYVHYLDAVRAEAAPHPLPLTALGFSQGVATVCRWVALGAHPVWRAILWAGQIPPELDLTVLAARVAEPVVIVHGSRDPFAEWMDVDAMRERLGRAGVAHEVRTFEGGHRLDRELLASLAG